MTLDIRTIVVMLILSSILMAVTLAVGIRTGHGGGFAKWSLSLGVFALGWLLIAARGAMPDIVTMAAADALLLSGLCLQLAAVIEFGGRRAPALLLYAPGPLLFAAAVPVVSDYVAFTLTVSLAFAMAYAVIAAQTLRLGDRAGAARWMLAIPYAATAVGLVARVSSMLIDPAAHPGLFIESPVLTAGFLGLFAVTCSGSIAFLLMLRERSEAEIRHLAMFDPLTELFNRRAFMKLADRELARARRTRLPIAVLMMDLDTFKRVNDDFGHQAGDRVLAAFAATAKRSVRTEDVLGRYGGEEFCAILPGADMPTALEIANRIRAALAGQPLAGLARGTTVSIGVAVCGAQTAVTLDEAIACADEALYRAKNAGRDRVVGVTLAAQEKTPRLTAIASR